MARRVINKSSMGVAFARPGYIEERLLINSGDELVTIAPPTGTIKFLSVLCTHSIYAAHDIGPVEELGDELALSTIGVVNQVKDIFFLAQFRNFINFIRLPRCEATGCTQNTQYPSSVFFYFLRN